MRKGSLASTACFRTCWHDMGNKGTCRCCHCRGRNSRSKPLAAGRVCMAATESGVGRARRGGLRRDFRDACLIATRFAKENTAGEHGSRYTKMTVGMSNNHH